MKNSFLKIHDFRDVTFRPTLDSYIKYRLESNFAWIAYYIWILNSQSLFLKISLEHLLI